MADRWVVGIDGSFASRAACTWAVRQSERFGAHLILVSAYSGGATNGATNSAASAMRELDASVADLIGELDAERCVLAGSAAKLLPRVVGATGARLLVIGRHGTGRVWHQTAGSVSRACVRHTHAPTVVVPSDWDAAAPARIIIGYDAGRDADAALRWAIEFAPADASVTAVAALELSPWLSKPAVDQLGEELRREEVRLLAGIDAVDPSGLVTRQVVTTGARPTLADASRTADLLVVGARGIGPAPRTLIGSTSTWLLDVAGCPVAVVPSEWA
jgi:nucleotide-binding universal stress UspA family protein